MRRNESTHIEKLGDMMPPRMNRRIPACGGGRGTGATYKHIYQAEMIAVMMPPLKGGSLSQ